MAVTPMFGDDPRPSIAPTDDAPISSELSDRLVPVAVSFLRRRVRLLDLRGANGREQSFRHTVSRWIAEHPQLAPIEMEWPAFVAAARQAPSSAPAGFVFNASRCGSTLLANMLSAPIGHLTLKESSTIGVLLRELLVTASESERLELEDLLAATLPLFGRIVGPRDGRPGPRLFVKPHSLATVSAATLLRLFPTTPAVFLYRDPMMVVASMLAKAPYGDLHNRPREETVADFPALGDLPSDLPAAAFYAYLWASPVESVLALPPGQCLLIDYEELVSSPLAVIQRLTRHFGIERSHDTIVRMSAVTAVYAKDASGLTPFDPGGAHHRPPPSLVQRAEVSIVAEDLYARLKARRRAQM
ncbi:MAG: sulfotransferase [Acidobacteriota bacterium]